MGTHYFARCWDCPRTGEGKDFCLEYGKYLEIKVSRNGIPKWCKKRKFTFVKKTIEVRDSIKRKIDKE